MLSIKGTGRGHLVLHAVVEENSESEFVGHGHIHVTRFKLPNWNLKASASSAVS